LTVVASPAGNVSSRVMINGGGRAIADEFGGRPRVGPLRTEERRGRVSRDDGFLARPEPRGDRAARCAELDSTPHVDVAVDACL
jgi:hypothetical protein